jgi:hypothetical protein
MKASPHEDFELSLLKFADIPVKHKLSVYALQCVLPGLLYHRYYFICVGNYFPAHNAIPHILFVFQFASGLHSDSPCWLHGGFGNSPRLTEPDDAFNFVGLTPDLNLPFRYIP